MKKKPPRGGEPQLLGQVVDFSRFKPSAASLDEIEHERREHEREQRINERAHRLDRATELELTDAMRGAIILGAGLQDTEALIAARQWIDMPLKPCLVLNGIPGCGKSVAAAWVLANSLSSGMWLRAENACRVFSASFGDQYDEQRALRATPLLVLDDVGTEIDPLRMLHVLVELLESRKSRRHRSIITSNLPKPKFEARYKSARLWSRLAESVQWAGSGGPDLRRQRTSP